MRFGLAAGAAIVLAGGLAPAVLPGGGDAVLAAGGAAMPFDFDGDGYADLGVGVPGEDLEGVTNAGAVQVIYGSATGPTRRDQLWHQGRSGVKNKLEKGDRFGQALTSADFDADGYADLAIGVPREDLGSTKNAGAVQVLYGTAKGLRARDQVWHQGKPGVPGKSETGDRFGETLAAGDVDGDGFADLVVGVPYEDLGSTENAGSSVLLRGSASGLTSAGAQAWNERSAGIAGTPTTRGHLAAIITMGDVTGDGRDDLVVSRDEPWVEGADNLGGGFHVLLGSSEGLTATGSQFVRLTSLGMSSDPSSLWVGDVNADGHGDLTVGNYNSVGLLHGHDDGLRPGPLGPPGTPGTDALWGYDAATETDHFGPAVTGDMTGDGWADLLIRVSRGQGDKGVVIVHGTPEGIGTDSQEWMLWGWQHNLLPLSGGTTVWQVNGYSGESVTVIEPGPPGTAGTATMWSQDSPGIKGTVEPGDGFGIVAGWTP